jgi:hypothetical protein
LAAGRQKQARSAISSAETNTTCGGSVWALMRLSMGVVSSMRLVRLPARSFW